MGYCDLLLQKCTSLNVNIQIVRRKVKLGRGKAVWKRFVAEPLRSL